MACAPLTASDEELLSIVRSWLDVLAAGDYVRAFENLGYAMARGEGAEAIRRDIEAYRAQDLYPGVSEFRVTDWRSARGGNPAPIALVKALRLHGESANRGHDRNRLAPEQLLERSGSGLCLDGAWAN